MDWYCGFNCLNNDINIQQPGLSSIFYKIAQQQKKVSSSPPSSPPLKSKLPTFSRRQSTSQQDIYFQFALLLRFLSNPPTKTTAGPEQQPDSHMGAPIGGKGGISSIMTLSSFVKGLIGAGSLSLAQQSMSGGILLYSFFLIALTYLALWCILRLVDCTEVIMLAEARRAMVIRKFKEMIVRRRRQHHGNHPLSPKHPNGISLTNNAIHHTTNLDSIDPTSTSISSSSPSLTGGTTATPTTITIPIPLIPLSDLPLPVSPAQHHLHNQRQQTTPYHFTHTPDNDITQLSEAHEIVIESDGIPIHQLDEYLDLNISLFDHYPQWSDDNITKTDRAGVKLPSFNEIGQVSFGWAGGVLVNFCIIVTQLGSCCAYVIFISGAMGEISGLSTQTLTLLLALPLILIAFLRNLKSLAPMASFGNFVYLYTLIVLFYQGFSAPTTTPVDELNLWDSSQSPIVFGSLSFALEGIVLCLPLKEKMNNPANFRRTMVTGMGIVLFVYFSLGNLGYLFYGPNTKSPIISNLDPTAWSTDSVKIALSISLFFTFAMQLFPVSLFADNMIDTYWFGFDFHSLRLSQQRKDSGHHHHTTSSTISATSTAKHNHLQYNQQQLDHINHTYNQTYGNAPSQQHYQQQQQQLQYALNTSPRSTIGSHYHGLMTQQEDQDPFLRDANHGLLNIDVNNDIDVDDDDDGDSMLNQYDILLARRTPRHRATSSAAIMIPSIMIGGANSGANQPPHHVLSPPNSLIGHNDRSQPQSTHSHQHLLQHTERPKLSMKSSLSSGPHSNSNNADNKTNSNNSHHQTVLTDGHVTYRLPGGSPDNNNSYNTLSSTGDGFPNAAPHHSFSTTHSIAPSFTHSTVAPSLVSHQPQRTSDNLLIYTDEQLIPAQQRCLRLFLQNLHRIFAVSLCIAIALIFPQFSLIIALFGSFTNALLAYILPALFWTQICGHHLITQQKLITAPQPPTTPSRTGSLTPHSTTTPVTTPGFAPKSPYSSAIRPVAKPNTPTINSTTTTEKAQFSIPTQLFNTVVWFPFDRLGKRARMPPVGISHESHNTLSNNTYYNNNHNYNNHTPSFPTTPTPKETDSLLSHHQSYTLPSSPTQWPHHETGLMERFRSMTFAYVVIIVGSVSSFIGVTAALKNLIAEFRPTIA